MSNNNMNIGNDPLIEINKITPKLNVHISDQNQMS